MSSTLRIAVAQPRSVLGDPEQNVAEHVRALRSVEARVVVFPELSLTGYGMDVQPVDAAAPVLAPLVEACATMRSVALVGAPTRSALNGASQISTLRIDASGVSEVYTKMNLGGDEPSYFQPGDAPAVIEVDGWRLGLAICKDTGHPEHTWATAQLGIDAYLAGVCETDEDRGVQPERADRVTADHQVWVAYASFAGPTGGGFGDTAGRSAVHDPTGAVRLQLGKDAGVCAATTLTRQ